MQNNLPNIYCTAEIKRLEELAVTENQISVDALMQRAGAAAFRILQQEWPHAQSILVVCGKGNNAGDGYVVAQCAKQAGFRVMVLALEPPHELRGAAYNAAQSCLTSGVDVESFAALLAKAEPNKVYAQFDVVVDALLGTGLKGKLAPDFSEAIKSINRALRPVLALDIPSGLLADTGVVVNMDEVVRAQVTATFIGVKCGLVTHMGRECCGKIICDDLDLPAVTLSMVQPNAFMLELQVLRKQLPRRARYAHKGDFGHMLLIGGDHGMGGAIRMAAEAAARVGAGLVSVVTRSDHIAAINTARPEIMCHGIENARELVPLIEQATCIVIGPGLGKEAWGHKLFTEVLRRNKKKLPLVIDADALNLLSGERKLIRLVRAHCAFILTPHPGEAGRLLKCHAEDIQRDRYLAAQALHHKYGGVAVLKGAGSIVSGLGSDSDCGYCSAKAHFIGVCPDGNPGMASGGMGDVLSGMIGGLLAQGLKLLDAAALAVCIHARAGDLAAAYGERGLLALDLLPHVRKLVN
jgi:ADP-dependent NAD(P)H-hydrate dehydratase / NAD(P)H-hydrate epimerase